MWLAVSIYVVWVIDIMSGQEFMLPGDIIPSHYDLKLLFEMDPSSNFSFFGVVDILLKGTKPTTQIVLNAKELTIIEEKIKLITVGPHIRGDTQYNGVGVKQVSVDSNELLTLTLAQELLTSEVYSLSIPFYGNVNKDSLFGVFIDSYIDSKTMDREYYLVGFFEAMGARSAFPCFDEPMYKATFRINIGHHKDYHALSNMPLESSTNIYENPFGYQASWPWNVTKYKRDFIWDHFDIAPKMSTYLVAFVLSKFVHVESDPTRSNTRMKVWARRDLIDKAKYAAFIAPEILSFYEIFFNMSFNLPKMDHVGVKNFKLGGFEGWGLITYGESNLLYDEEEFSIDIQAKVTSVIAHEVGHQWFGNLVTMKWWNELWLKEGFAYFMQTLATVDVLPQIKDTFISLTMKQVIEADALGSSHPVMAPMEATSPKRIFENYNSMSYTKGNMLIRMLYCTLGEEVFKEGIRNYLKNNAYKSTVQDDLWQELTEASLNHHLNLPNNTTVARLMSGWTRQSGYPLLTVLRDYNTNSLAVFQERFISGDMSLRAIGSRESWWIPLSVLAQRDQPGNASITWLADNEGTSVPHSFQHAAGDDEWLLFNIDMIAVCRVNYDAHNWALIIATLKSENYTSIPLLSRVQLLMDAFALSWSGFLDYGITLELAGYLQHEADGTALTIGLMQLAHIENVLKRSSDLGIFQKYVRKLIGEKYQTLRGHGKKVILRRGNYNSVMMQKNIFQWSCEVTMPGCEDRSVESFREWMESKNPDKDNPVPAEMRATVYCIGVKRGSASHWHFMLNQTQSMNPESAELAKLALACTRDVWLLYRTLEMSLEDAADSPLGQSADKVIDDVVASHVGYYVAKDFIYKNIEKLVARSHNFPLLYLETLLQQFTSQDELEEFLAWREKRGTLLESSTYTIAQGIEKARINIGWVNTNRQLVVDKMKQLAEENSDRRMTLTSNAATKIFFTNYLIYIIYLFVSITNVW